MKPLRLVALFALAGAQVTARVQADALIVVEDRGGVSALPYYEALSLQPRTPVPSPPSELPRPPIDPFSESDMLPVRSMRLSPGPVERRVLEAPGLPPFFLVGDDAQSRAWLQQRAPHLRELKAAGLVVNVDSAEELAELRALVPGLSLVPASADDLVERLGLRHYPVLITSTGIEQ